MKLESVIPIASARAPLAAARTRSRSLSAAPRPYPGGEMPVDLGVGAVNVGDFGLANPGPP